MDEYFFRILCVNTIQVKKTDNKQECVIEVSLNFRNFKDYVQDFWSAAFPETIIVHSGVGFVKHEAGSISDQVSVSL